MILIPILVGIPLLVHSLMLIDKLFKIQYQYDKEEWIKSGSPRGFFWAPEDSKNWPFGVGIHPLICIEHAAPELLKDPNYSRVFVRIKLYAVIWVAICVGVGFARWKGIL